MVTLGENDLFYVTLSLRNEYNEARENGNLYHKIEKFIE